MIVKAERKSILPKEFQGVCDITGQFGVGKSYFLAGADLPTNIAFFDYDDGKARGLHEQLGFGLYRNMTAEFAAEGPEALWDASVEAFKGLEKDRYTVAIIDNATKLMGACKVIVQRRSKYYSEQYGVPEKFIKRDTRGNARGIVNQLISVVCGLLHNQGVHLVGVSHHLGAMYKDGVEVLNKYRIKGYRSWQQASILTIILIPGDFPPVPSGIIRKEQLGQMSINGDPSPEQLAQMIAGDLGHDTARRLPERLPKATMQAIRYYLTHPASISEPEEGEALKMAEVEPFLAKLSTEQIALHHNALRIRAMEMEEEQGILGGGAPFAREKAADKAEEKAADITVRARELKEAGKSPAEIAKELGVPRARVNRMLK